MTQGWGGLAVFDFDQDGDLDVFLSGGPNEPNRLYRNDDQGQAFVDVAEPAGVTTVEDHIAGTGVGDFNGDGWLDLVLTRQRYLLPEADADTSCLLFLNNGDGTFVDQSAASGLGAVAMDGMGVAVADVNGDGLLDLYVAHYRLGEINGFAPVEPSSPDVLFMNLGVENGIPLFEDATATAGVAGQLLTGRTPETADQTYFGVTVATYATDVDNDGHIDLFALHDTPGTVELFHNNGDGTFASVQRETFALRGAWMGMDGGDYDRDGDLDYFATNVGSTTFGLIPGFTFAVNAAMLLPGGSPFVALFENDSGGGLTDVAANISVAPPAVLPPSNDHGGQGLAAYEFGFGCAWFDSENRGWLDLYWLGDLIPAEIGRPPTATDYHGVGRFLYNDGDRSFTDMTADRGLHDIPAGAPLAFAYNENGRAVAAMDLNNDGFRDVILVNGERPATHAAGSMRVFLNPANTGGNYLNVKLVGTDGNTHGIGARVEILVAGVMMPEEVLSTKGAFTGVQPLAQFGVGAAMVVEEVRVRWPRGDVSVMENVAANQTLTVTQDTP